MRQLVYTMFISNNRASFPLWGKENLVRREKISKYYENYCIQNFVWLFISLLTATFVKDFSTFLQLNCSNLRLRP